MLSDPHIGFVIAAYALAASVLAVMIVSIVVDSMRLNAHLDDATRALEAAREQKRRDA